METLIESFKILLDLTPMDYVRSFHDKINWKNRLIGLMGQKGVGKSTLLLQHIKNYDNLEETLYVQADDMYFAGHGLFETAYDFFKRGGKRLYIDEIHKYKGWSTEIKMIYDRLPSLSVVYSGSSLLALKKGGSADLSRRTIEYTMPGLSFREYLNIANGWNLKTSSLADILKGKVDFPYGEHRPLKYFEEYRKKGYYPYFKEEDFLTKLKQAINETVEHDIPAYAEMPIASAVKLKKLMYVLANSVPFKPNYSKLSRELEIGRNQLPEYINYLEKARLFNGLKEKGASDSIIQKVEKLYLSNSNIAYAISDTKPDEGTVREMLFLTWMRELYIVTTSKISDFEIDGITFEVGGKSKKGQQVKDASIAYLVKDGIEYAGGNSIPIWMFGFVY
ncbi:MAG: ATP-binding protein [Bacteroidales bacterium]|nr:ATP-binding protein [Bacteroidales bacterium]